MTGTESVLFTALHAEVLPADVWAKISGRRLLDRGADVEWHDGTDVRRWRLPDQPPAAGLAELAGVSRVLVPSPYRQSWAGTRVVLIFTDPDGRRLAWINTYRARERRLAQAAYPDEAFAGLGSRGVPVTEETIKSYREFCRRHPGSSDSRLTGLANRVAYAWL